MQVWKRDAKAADMDEAHDLRIKLLMLSHPVAFLTFSERSTFRTSSYVIGIENKQFS